MKKSVISTFVIAMVILFVTGPAIHAEDGAALYKAKCAMCHGTSGAGDTVMGKKLGAKALGSAEVQKQNDAALSDIITKGKGKMPSFDKKVSSDQIKALVAQIRTFAKK